MIREETYYEVHCDQCGERLDLDGVTAWESFEDAEDALNYAGWQKTDCDRVYCDGCVDSGEILLEGSSDGDYDDD